MTTKGSFKLFIPTAGIGSRLHGHTKHLNKCLVEIGLKPTISHIIEKFDESVPVVIALGHKGDLVRDFLELAYPKRTFEFFTVDPFEGEGSGLGLSILCCKEALQAPFLFCSCDTIVGDQIEWDGSNWVGISEHENSIQYRTFSKGKDGLAEGPFEKGDERGQFPYIGLAAIQDYESFWKYVNDDDSIIDEFIQTGESLLIRKMIGDRHTFKIKSFDWYDIGNLESLEKTRAKYTPQDAPHILPKENEAIWFFDDSVIKFSTDKNFIKDRVERTKNIQKYVPEILGVKEHYYQYEYVTGEIMSKVATPGLFQKLLEQSKTFWERKELDNSTSQKFTEVCKKFYFDKTKQRINLFYENFNFTDDVKFINGKMVPSTESLLELVDWNKIFEGVPVTFHGDFHFENILYLEDKDKFVFLDWRQNFGGISDHGDLYYDLAKLNHGLIVSHEIVANDYYTYRKLGQNVEIDIHQKMVNLECQVVLKQFHTDNNLDWKKTEILTYLIYLNIAGLHHEPYSHFLYFLGRSGLHQTLVKENL